MPASGTWKVDGSDDFQESYRKLARKNPRLKDAVDAMMDRVEDDPLIGDPKTGRLHGLRQVHVMGHWVLTWSLEPVIVNRKHLSDLRQLWFIELEHHPEG